MVWLRFESKTHILKYWSILPLINKLYSNPFLRTLQISKAERHVPEQTINPFTQIFIVSMIFYYVVLCCVTSLQSCLTLCDSMDGSPVGSSVHGILQGRILESVAVPSSRGSFWPRDWTHISYISCIGKQVFFLPLASPGKPRYFNILLH